ncbi:unnamed protein product [Rotaria sordida]|uniref:Kinesin light chain n=1 Tax=Rotaria sordida TaxID=392033 RepID=A0A819I8C8_9BILA|nr:unnamed protein product [Rotaria sordida]CAF3912437.1 unnamed protein product [Rotaria sordida]
MGDYDKALSFHGKALNIQENVQCNPLECATTYTNLGETYHEMEDHSTALTYFQKGLQIREKKLPKYHPDLAVIYHNLAKLYLTIRQYNELTKHDLSKDKVSTYTQRIRFNTIFPNYHDRFQLRIPSRTTTQIVIPSSTTNNESITIACKDINLSRIHFKEKEECTPSDAQLNTSK